MDKKENTKKEVESRNFVVQICGIGLYKFSLKKDAEIYLYKKNDILRLKIKKEFNIKHDDFIIVERV